MNADVDLIMLGARSGLYIITEISYYRMILVENENGERLIDLFPIIASWGTGKGARQLKFTKIKTKPDAKFHTFDAIEITMESELAV